MQKEKSDAVVCPSTKIDSGSLMSPSKSNFRIRMRLKTTKSSSNSKITFKRIICPREPTQILIYSTNELIRTDSGTRRFKTIRMLMTHTVMNIIKKTTYPILCNKNIRPICNSFQMDPQHLIKFQTDTITILPDCQTKTFQAQAKNSS